MVILLKSITLAILMALILKPICWIISAFMLSALFKRKKIKQTCFYTGILFILFFSNGYISNQAMLLWEEPPTPIREIALHYEVGVVLSGVTQHQKSPSDRIYLQAGGDRITHTAMLYRRSIIKKILITGGGTFENGKKANESIAMKELFLQMGVLEKDIIIEPFANNTYENAKFSKKIILEKFKNSKILLITSAFHMTRAKACFKKQDLIFDTFSVDFKSIDQDNLSFSSRFIPSTKSLQQWDIIINEIGGLIMYKLLNRV